MCNITFEEGQFSRNHKFAKVKLILKIGKKDKMDNYRLISILPILSKIIDKNMNVGLINFLENLI